MPLASQPTPSIDPTAVQGPATEASLRTLIEETRALRRAIEVLVLSVSSANADSLSEEV